ncbi:MULTISPECIES: diguanylate cyclase [unclassified Ruegeria]|uniref:sensor domain-containing diguanylate cyclase n=1 Tax=unclassified Ruegeria TaxID=2625375 RepID=UPI001AD9DE5E|nr:MULTISPECIES: diguanylate cyclase [unclassified Ruegeria]MBO9411272.1 diguanylate cyclase [Ruegeria sp. R8_1]MBO9415473.1 diguanylate cyclase [Ruegeria sp. R8_2]
MEQKLKLGWSYRLKLAAIVLTLLSLTAFSGWGIYAVPAPVVDRMLEADLRKEATQLGKQVTSHLKDVQATFQTGFVGGHDQEFLELLPATSDIYRFKLFNADGRVFWSSRSSDLGSVNSKPYFDAVIKQGNIYYKHEEKPLSEVEDFDGDAIHASGPQTRHVAEIYTPIIRDGRFLGAIEFYSDITDVRNLFIDRVRLSLFILSTVALLAFSVVTLVVFRSNRRQVQNLRGRAAKERELMDEQLRLAREVRLLGELNEWLQSSRSLDELFDMVSRFMTHILPEAEGSVYVYSNSRDVLDGCASWNGGTHKSHIHPEGCWGLRRGRTYEFGASEIDFVCEHAEPHDGRPYFCFPILAHGETVGLLHLRALEGRDTCFHKSRKLAQLCAEQISMAIANVRMRDQLHDQSVRDPLTGLFNRRHMTETLRKSISRSQQTGAPLSLIAVDVDHFKKFNDTHGHDAGDMVLRAVGSALEQGCDRDEIACRIGGEEFMLILPDNTPEDAMTRAEQLRQAVEGITVRYGEKSLPRITISVGVANYPAHGTMPQDLMRSADDALYEAKDKGRNQVQVAGKVDPSSGRGDQTGDTTPSIAKISAKS